MAVLTSGCGIDSTVSDTEARRFSPSAVMRSCVKKIKQLGEKTNVTILEVISMVALQRRYQRMDIKRRLLTDNLSAYEKELRNKQEEFEHKRERLSS